MQVNQIKNLVKISAIVFLILLSILFSGCTTPSNSSYNEDFSFFILNGQEKHISTYAGKAVLIDFTGVNCPYCVPQIFALKEVENNYSSDDVVIISLFVWMILGETVQDISDLVDAYACESPCDAENAFTSIALREAKAYFNYAEGLELNWVIGYDDSEGTLYTKFGQKGIPYLLILDENGNIYYSNIGYTDYSTLAQKLDELIS